MKTLQYGAETLYFSGLYFSMVLRQRLARFRILFLFLYLVIFLCTYVTLDTIWNYSLFRVSMWFGCACTYRDVYTYNYTSLVPKVHLPNENIGMQKTRVMRHCEQLHLSLFHFKVKSIFSECSRVIVEGNLNEKDNHPKETFLFFRKNPRGYDWWLVVQYFYCIIATKLFYYVIGACVSAQACCLYAHYMY